MEGVKFESVLMRIASITKSTKPKDLAPILGISPAAVSKALTQKHIPRTWYNTLVTKYNLTHSWLLFGDEPKGRREVEQETLGDSPSTCTRCMKLENKIDRIERQRDELMDEVRQLWKENSGLKEQIGNLHIEIAELKKNNPPTAGNQHPMISTP